MKLQNAMASLSLKTAHSRTELYIKAEKQDLLETSDVFHFIREKTSGPLERQERLLQITQNIMKK